MAVNQIQGDFILTEFSEDRITWKTLVCETTSNFEISSDVSEEKTKCGSIKTTSEPSWSFSGDAVTNAKPSASEWSYADVLRWSKSRQLIYVRRMSPEDALLSLDEGQAFYQGGQGFISNVSGSTSAGESAKFSWTLEGSGAIDVEKVLTIDDQPLNKTQAAGATLTLNVTASGGTAPYTYQWKKGGVNLVGNGATSANYSKAAAASGDSGAYTVVVKDADDDTVTSTTATVSIT